MGLLDEIKASNVPGHECTVSMLLRTLPKADAADLGAAIADESILSTVIATVLKGHGHKVSPDVIRRHRRGLCRCGAR